MSVTSSTGTLSSAGIGSGLDVNTIVTKLVAIESQPLVDLQSSASTMKTQLSAVGQVQSYMSSLSDAASALDNSALWTGTTGTSSDASSVGVVASSGATAASYNVDVTALSESAGSAAFASSSSTVGTGTMTISLGSWNADQSSFSANASATPVSINIEATDTLADIRDKINSSGSGVVASIVTDSSGARLSIRSASTGVANAFQINVADGGDGNDTDANGLSALAYDPSTGTQGMARNQAASDASATINGMAVKSASNTMTNVLDGLTLTLNKVTAAGSPVNVTVAANTSAIQTAITAFSNSYNNAMSYLRTATAYDPATSTAGTLQGDMTTVNLMTQLRTMMGGSSTASSVFQRFSDIGLTPQKDGTLAVDTTKLGAAMNNLPELQKMLAAPLGTGAASSTSGMAQQIYGFTSNLLSFDGALKGETDGINARISDNSDQQTQMEDRIAAYQTRVQAQYQALDTQMASLTSLSTYVSQQMAMLSKSA